MTDGSIESELKSVHKKLEDIQKKQEWIEKLHQLERKQQQRMGNSPSSHSYEMMWYNIDI